MILSRRAGLKLMASSLMLATGRLFSARSSSFWNNEDPAQWSTDEIKQLTTDSPWAKPVTAEVNAYSPQSSSGGGGRRGGSGRMGRAGSSSNPSANSPKFSGVVRWVSAKPILLALKIQLPPDFAQHYVIGVSGLPVISGHGEGADNTDSYEALKEVTYLRVRGQEPAQPGIIQQDPNDTSTILFGFLHQFLDLSKAKAAAFSTTMGPLNVKAKFDLAHMIYKGELAV
jgi:hypothetical protein